MSDKNKVFGGAKIIAVASKIEKKSAQELADYDEYIAHPYDAQRGEDLIAYWDGLSDGKNAYQTKSIEIKSTMVAGSGFTIVDGNEDAARKQFASVNEDGDSLQDIIDMLATSYNTNGNGYVEIVRGLNGKISELYNAPSQEVYRRPRWADTAFWYEGPSGVPVMFPIFKPGEKENEYSIAHLRARVPTDRYYGHPAWRGAIEAIELSYYASLYNKNFFVNSGRPDLAIIVEGGEFDEPTEQRIKEFIVANYKGVMNSHRVLYLPVNDENVKVKFETISESMKDRDGSFQKLQDTCRDIIVAAHGIPPRLAGIVASGSLGGGEEALTQLEMFNAITISPLQRKIENLLNPVLAEMQVPAQIKLNKMKIDIKEKTSEVCERLFNANLMKRNEARDKAGLTINEGEDGYKSELESVTEKEITKSFWR